MKTIKGTITPALAFLLALLMLFYVLPADVYGAIAEGSGTDSAGTEEKEAEALFELTELRSAETKYILMSDGTIQPAGLPAHRPIDCIIPRSATFMGSLSGSFADGLPSQSQR